jgi:hypothetical protein
MLLSAFSLFISAPLSMLIDLFLDLCMDLHPCWSIGTCIRCISGLLWRVNKVR